MDAKNISGFEFLAIQLFRAEINFVKGSWNRRLSNKKWTNQISRYIKKSIFFRISRQMTIWQSPMTNLRNPIFVTSKMLFVCYFCNNFTDVKDISGFEFLKIQLFRAEIDQCKKFMKSKIFLDFPSKYFLPVRLNIHYHNSQQNTWYFPKWLRAHWELWYWVRPVENLGFDWFVAKIWLFYRSKIHWPSRREVGRVDFSSFLHEYSW